MPAHRDEPRCESEGQLYYPPCIIRKHAAYPLELRGTPRVDPPVLSHTWAARALAQWQPAMPTSPLARSPRLRTPGRAHGCYMAVALLLGSGS